MSATPAPESVPRAKAAWSELESTELLERTRAGDALAREELFARLGRSLRNIALNRLRGGNARHVDDAVQDALVHVFRHLDNIETNVGGFAYRCLLNTINHVYRDPRNFVPESAPADQPHASQVTHPAPPDPLLRERMGAAAARLSGSDRELLRLVAAGLPPREIVAQMPETNVNAVYQRIHRATQRFRRHLEEQGVELTG